MKMMLCDEKNFWLVQDQKTDRYTQDSTKRSYMISIVMVSHGVT